MSIKTLSRLFAALSIGLLVASCQDEMQSSGLGTGAKQNRPLRPETLALMQTKGMSKEDPILVRAFKQENTLEIWKRDNTGKFALLKSYPMCAWGGTIGPKIREGDKQSPEGFYTVTPGRMNPNSQFYLAYDIGYPNAFDRAFGRTGAAVMVHGNCTGSAGCFVMTDEQVEEIYALAREAFAGGQKSFQVQAYPFHMTAENMAKNRKNPNMAFWKNIKQGYDHFEVTKLEPKVDVCDKHYVFDARTTDPLSTTFNAAGACPAYEVPKEISTAVAAKEADDDKSFKIAVAQLDEQAKTDDDRARRLEERAVAERIEKSKPQPGQQIASWFGAKPQTEETMALAEPVPISVPLPRPSPHAFAVTQVAAVEPAPSESPTVARSMFGFGASSPTSAGVAAAAAVAEPTTTASVAATPISVPLPGARPVPMPATMVEAAPAPVSAPAAAEDRPFWKKINPFGG